MKKLLYSLFICTAPLIAGPNCMDNSQHLTKAYDDKEWHSVECYCDCSTIKGGHCADCGHMQNAHPMTVIQPMKIRTTPTKIYIPETPQDALKKLAARYVKNKYDL
jgi:hypothetical protein